MSGVIDPCPWCHETDMDWTIPAYSRLGYPECSNCGARGPSFVVATGPRDHEKITGQAIAAWNRP